MFPHLLPCLHAWVSEIHSFAALLAPVCVCVCVRMCARMCMCVCACLECTCKRVSRVHVCECALSVPALDISNLQKRVGACEAAPKGYDAPPPAGQPAALAGKLKLLAIKGAASCPFHVTGCSILALTDFVAGTQLRGQSSFLQVARCPELRRPQEPA